MARARPGKAEPPDAGVDLGPDADPESVARTIVLSKLAAQARSRRELADTLRTKGVPDDVAGTVLDRFAEVGLVDDAAFAESWVRSRQATRGLSRRALAHELRHKGVADETVREAVDEIDPEDERAAAQALVARRLPGTRRLDRAVRMRRLTAMLARKGYPAGLATAVVRAALAADGDPTDDSAWSDQPDTG